MGAVHLVGRDQKSRHRKTDTRVGQRRHMGRFRGVGRLHGGRLPIRRQRHRVPTGEYWARPPTTGMSPWSRRSAGDGSILISESNALGLGVVSTREISASQLAAAGNGVRYIH